MIDRKHLLVGVVCLLLLAAGCIQMPANEASTWSDPGASLPQTRPGEIFVEPNDPSLPGVSADNVMIIIEKIESSQATAFDASVAFLYADDNIVLESPAGKLAARNGIRIGLGGDDFHAKLEAALQRSKRLDREETFITVLSGYEGSIRVGEEVFFERLGYWSPIGYEVLVEREFLGRSLVVRPRILQGGLVEVEVFPRFTRRGGRGVIDVTELATKVVVRNGQSLVIGGTTSASSDVGSALFEVHTREQDQSMTLILTPHIGGMNVKMPK